MCLRAKYIFRLMDLINRIFVFHYSIFSFWLKRERRCLGKRIFELTNSITVVDHWLKIRKKLSCSKCCLMILWFLVYYIWTGDTHSQTELIIFKEMFRRWWLNSVYYCIRWLNIIRKIYENKKLFKENENQKIRKIGSLVYRKRSRMWKVWFPVQRIFLTPSQS